MQRRKFLERSVQFLSAVITALLSFPVLRFLTGSLSEETRETWLPVASVSALSGRVTQVQYGRRIRDGWWERTAKQVVWVRKKPDGSYVAFEPHCTHLGCGYSWDAKSEEFQCPCHGGKFDIDGKRIAGPPQRDLDRFDVKVDNGTLKIGKLIG